MKGLLIKDIGLLKGQKTFFLTVFVVAIVLLFANSGGTAATASYVICYIGFVSSFFVMSTISYDEFDNGNAFLFTMPFRRKTYALEKYIFGFILGIGTMAVMTVIEAVYFRFSGIAADWQLIMVTFGSGAACLGGFLAIMLPFQFKFGADKARIAMIATFAAVFAVTYVVAKGLKAGKVNLGWMKELVQTLSGAGIAVMIAVVVLVVLGLSIAVSTKILNRKEF